MGRQYAVWALLSHCGQAPRAVWTPLVNKVKSTLQYPKLEGEVSL